MSLTENVTTLTPPRTGNYEFARFNALRHGVLSQHAVLPWEDRQEYLTLIEALVAEHGPQGPTEEHLVEELAGGIWRKRRLRFGENAVHHRALKSACDLYRHTAVFGPQHDYHRHARQRGSGHHQFGLRSALGRAPAAGPRIGAAKQQAEAS
jgi:hypothetical protein